MQQCNMWLDEAFLNTQSFMFPEVSLCPAEVWYPAFSSGNWMFLFNFTEEQKSVTFVTLESLNNELHFLFYCPV